jgi:3-dehydro-4-phosphotetronate decarboxylase
MNEAKARDEICRIGCSLFDRGYVHASAGNISVRLDDGFLITPTDACLGFLDPAELAFVNQAGQQISGAPASKTLALHRRIYQATEGFSTPTRCVLHTHCTHAVALSLVAWPVKGLNGQVELLPPITPYFVMKVGHVPVIDYHAPGALQAAQAVAETIAVYARQGIALRAVMLSRLGPYAWHQSPAAAMATLEELEETAKLWWLTQARPAPLQKQQLTGLQQAFGVHW